MLKFVLPTQRLIAGKSVMSQAEWKSALDTLVKLATETIRNNPYGTSYISPAAVLEKGRELLLDADSNLLLTTDEIADPLPSPEIMERAAITFASALQQHQPDSRDKSLTQAAMHTFFEALASGETAYDIWDTSKRGVPTVGIPAIGKCTAYRRRTDCRQHHCTNRAEARPQRFKAEPGGCIPGCSRHRQLPPLPRPPSKVGGVDLQHSLGGRLDCRQGETFFIRHACLH